MEEQEGIWFGENRKEKTKSSMNISKFTVLYVSFVNSTSSGNPRLNHWRHFKF
ncbi:hypothetical protein ERO13_D05G318750v2 [Gossypium hirsutum]|nr:hypothetical protein ERO13_D05G318750v2 [Gossypium hirsutum]